MITKIINTPQSNEEEWIDLKMLDGNDLQLKIDMKHFEIGYIIKIGGATFLYKNKQLLEEIKNGQQ